MTTWDQMQTTSFGGVEFQVIGVDDSFSMRMAQYSYPWRSGADLESLGTEARPTSLEAYFDGPNYKTNLEAMITMFANGATRLFVHPLLGQWQAKISSMSVRHESAARNYASVSIEIIEDGVDIPLAFQQETVDNLKNNTEESLEELELEASLYPNLEKITDAIDAVKDFLDTAEDAVSDVEKKVNQTINQLNSAYNEVRRKQQLIMNPIKRAIQKTSYNCKRVGERIASIMPQAKEEDIEANVPLTMIAHKLYGDSTRSSDLEELNRVRNPFLIPKGEKIKVYTS